MFSRFVFGPNKKARYPNPASGDSSLGQFKDCHVKPHIVPPGSKPETKENPLAQLKDYDTIVIMDDSGSMTLSAIRNRPLQGTRWEQAGVALKDLAIAAELDDDGIDLYLLNQKDNLEGCKDPEEIKKFFHRIKPNPNHLTPLGPKLAYHLKKYVKSYREEKEMEKQGIEIEKKMKPMNIIVVTDGRPDNEGEVIKSIKETALALNELGAPTRQIGIQFVQVGDDEKATKFLDRLDNELKGELGRDMVDTIRSVPGEKFDLIKGLLGAINARMDKQADKNALPINHV